MKKRRSGLAAALLLLGAVGIGNAEISFHGVLDPKLFVIRVDSVSLTPPDTTVLTPDWGTHPPMDTFHFTGVIAWPETLVLHGTVGPFPLHWPIVHPEPDIWYPIGHGSGPYVMFYGDYGVEESKPAAAPLPRLAVSPSIVTGQMTVRLQSAHTSRPVVEIHNAVGNVVRSLGRSTGADGAATATWNREDESGRLVPEGVYFCRCAAADVIAVRKVLVAH